MKHILFILAAFLSVALNAQTEVHPEKYRVETVLNNWHKAAAEADFSAYFGYMASEAVFIGTDATENWQLQEFKDFSKPYFDKGKAWSFTAVQRTIYMDAEGNTAWFDELLDTQMKLCRGSGILKKTDGQWKIVHYVLSIAIPNENVDEVVKLKSVFDDKLTTELKGKKL